MTTGGGKSPAGGGGYGDRNIRRAAWRAGSALS